LLAVELLGADLGLVSRAAAERAYGTAVKWALRVDVSGAWWAASRRAEESHMASDATPDLLRLYEAAVEKDDGAAVEVLMRRTPLAGDALAMRLISATMRGRENVVRAFLKAGASPSRRLVNFDGEVLDKTINPLTAAASRGRVGLCELFLARGAKDDDEHTALLLAIHKGHLECVQLLLSARSGPPPPEALLIATRRSTVECVRLVLDAGAALTNSCLEAASYREEPRMMKALLGAGADARSLHGIKALVGTVAMGDEASMRVLLRAGAGTRLSSIDRQSLVDFLLGYEYPKHANVTEAGDIATRQARGVALMGTIDAFADLSGRQPFGSFLGGL